MDKRHYMLEATRTDRAGLFLLLLVKLFGRKVIDHQGDDLVILSIYRGKCYFLDRIRLGK